MRSIIVVALFTLLSSVAAAQTRPLMPVGQGSTIIETSCTECHGVERIVRAGHTLDEWRNIVPMMKHMGAKLTPQQTKIVTVYLAKNFPPRSSSAAIVSGNVRVKFHEWTVPTPGSRPHDPLAARDGSIWYSGQMASVLGRIDPKTGAIKEYRLPPDSGPHGLVQDHGGNIWYTANFAGYIGKLDPRTGAVTQYKLPDPDARDPHTPLFDPSGILWFTVQSGNMVGRLDPKRAQSNSSSLPMRARSRMGW